MTEVILIPFVVKRHIVWKDSLHVESSTNNHQWVVNPPGEKMYPVRACGEWLMYYQPMKTILTNGVISLLVENDLSYLLLTNTGTIWGRKIGTEVWMVKEITDYAPRVADTPPPKVDSRRVVDWSGLVKEEVFRLGKKYAKYIPSGGNTYLVIQELSSIVTEISEFDDVIRMYILPEISGKIGSTFETSDGEFIEVKN